VKLFVHRGLVRRELWMRAFNGGDCSPAASIEVRVVWKLVAFIDVFDAFLHVELGFE
jgi:hypothetical protein